MVKIRWDTLGLAIMLSCGICQETCKRLEQAVSRLLEGEAEASRVLDLLIVLVPKQKGCSRRSLKYPKRLEERKLPETSWNQVSETHGRPSWAIPSAKSAPGETEGSCYGEYGEDWQISQPVLDFTPVSFSGFSVVRYPQILVSLCVVPCRSV